MKPTKKKKSKMKPEELRDRALGYLKDENKLQEKYGILKKVVVVFPRKKKAPVLGSLAIWLLKKSGGVIDLHFIERE